MKREKCPICKLEVKQILEYEDLRDIFGFSEGRFDVKRCKNCESLYLENPLEKSNLHKAYPIKYHCYKDSNNFFQKLKKILVKKECKGLLKKIKRNGKLNILEVGAGTGIYSQYFKKLGHNVWATDISQDVLEILEKKQINTKKGSFEKLNFEEGVFDIIILSHALEHFYDPIEVFDKINKISAKDGLTYIKTPNSKTLLLSRYSTVLDVPRHIVVLSEKSFKVLTKDKFKIIKFSNEINTNELISYFKFKYKKGVFDYKNPLLIILFLPLAIFLSLTKRSSRLNVTLKKA